MRPEIQHPNVPNNGRQVAAHATFKHSNQISACCRFIPCIDSVRNTAATLASYARSTAGGWVCFPKIATLAEKAGVSLRTAKYHLKQLVELGVIAIKHQHKLCKKTGQKRQASSLYTFQVGKLRQYAHELKINGKRATGKGESQIAPSNCTAKTIPYGNKQNTKKPSSFLNKNQSNHQQWRYDEANKKTAQAWQDMQTNKSDDPMRHIDRIKRLLGRTTRRA